ncbi:hypothetical protein [Nesterenkonia jeotgali]|uniref:Holin n=1 Tax=Nesterenkonia jeotgali TaxID=317018 RepID=A0A0W8IG39_9MICC|nr:hypothetical protein [Nesterenkonia jeotgali]KUG58994.1 hypothetical protein AVL63_02935 [Nesterenkonia jeotgali]
MAQTVPNKGIHDPRLRKAGYIILVAALGVLTVFDVIDENTSDQIVNIVGQVLTMLGLSVAAANTPTEVPVAGPSEPQL